MPALNPTSGDAPALRIVKPEASPLLSLYARWCAAQSEYLRLCSFARTEDLNSPEINAASDFADCLLGQLILMQPATMAEIAAMAHALWDRRAYVPEEAIVTCEGGVPMVLAAIWRAASGERGHPRIKPLDTGDSCR